MEVLYERVTGFDVGKDTLTVCVRTSRGGRGGSRHAVTRTFKTTIGLLHVMRNWFVEQGMGDREDGFDVDLLEAAVLLPRRVAVSGSAPS